MVGFWEDWSKKIWEDITIKILKNMFANVQGNIDQITERGGWEKVKNLLHSTNYTCGFLGQDWNKL